MQKERQGLAGIFDNIFTMIGREAPHPRRRLYTRHHFPPLPFKLTSLPTNLPSPGQNQSGTSVSVRHHILCRSCQPPAAFATAPANWALPFSAVRWLSQPRSTLPKLILTPSSSTCADRVIKRFCWHECSTRLSYGATQQSLGPLHPR